MLSRHRDEIPTLTESCRPGGYMLTGCVVNSVASNDRNNGNALFADLPRGT